MRWISTSNKYLRSYSSLALLNDYFKKSSLNEILDQEGRDLFKAIAGLFALGKLKLEDIDLFVTNRYFQEALDIDLLPSAERLSARIRDRSIDICEAAEQLNRRWGESPQSWFEMYKKESDFYTSDFMKNVDVSESLFGALLGIHVFVIHCIRDISALGTTGEFPNNALFSGDIKAKLDSDGFAIIPAVLSSEEVSRLREIVLTLAEWEKQKNTAYLYSGSDRCQRVYNLLNKHQKFRELIQMPIVLEIMEHMFARDTLHDKYSLCSWHANIIGGGGDSSILHADAAVPEPLPNWIIRSNVNFMLDDFTKENGATLCLPGSHKFFRKPTREDQKRVDLLPMVAPRGSIAIWHGHLWHKSGENRTNRQRIALLGGFAATYLREMCLEENHFQIVKEEVLEKMSPTLQRLVGLNHGIKKGALQEPPTDL